jgi:peptidoglycan lytic transglycosylase
LRMRGGARSCRVRSARLPLLLALLQALAACVHAPQRPPPSAPTVLPPPPPDVARIPEPVPRAEPRSASGNPPFYDVAGHRYVVLASAAGYHERGVASWYGPDFHGLRTATGERYDMFAMTAAHKTLPIPCYARVTNLSNGHSIVVRINDRGPFVGNRIIDLSYTAAIKLDMIRNGTAFVEVEALTPGVPPAVATLPATAAAASSAAVGISSVPPVAASDAPGPAPSDTPPVAPLGALPAALPPPASATFYIQVGAYAQAENARRAAQKLRDAGLEHVFTLAPAANQPLQRVRIGPISSVQQFDQLTARLSALGFPGARLAQD